MAAASSSRLPVVGDNAAILQLGTESALLDRLKSGGHRLAGDKEVQRVSWGGARNRYDRSSDCLTLAQAANIIAAAHHAIRLGLPLNRHLTVHLEKSGVVPCGGAKAIGAYLKLYRQFLASRGFPFAYVWVREDDDGDGTKGAHVHILMHVPPEGAPAAIRRQALWLSRVTGLPYRSGALHTSRIGGKVRTATTLPEVYRPNLDAVVGYLLKGLEQSSAATLGLRRHDEGGLVIGKRCGWSENIGAASRARIEA